MLLRVPTDHVIGEEHCKLRKNGKRTPLRSSGDRLAHVLSWRTITALAGDGGRTTENHQQVASLI